MTFQKKYALNFINLSLFILFLLTFIRLSFVTWRAFLPLEIDDREIWNAWNTVKFLSKDFYPEYNALNINNYPPLYFVITSLFELSPKYIILEGRIISIISAFVIAANGYILSTFYGSKIKPSLLKDPSYMQNLFQNRS